MMTMLRLCSASITFDHASNPPERSLGSLVHAIRRLLHDSHWGRPRVEHAARRLSSDATRGVLRHTARLLYDIATRRRVERWLFLVRAEAPWSAPSRACCSPSRRRPSRSSRRRWRRRRRASPPRRTASRTPRRAASDSAHPRRSHRARRRPRRRRRRRACRATRACASGAAARRGPQTCGPVHAPTAATIAVVVNAKRISSRHRTIARPPMGSASDVRRARRAAASHPPPPPSLA